MSRKTARELAFKVIFASNFQEEELNVEDMLLSLKSESDESLETSKEDVEYIKDVACGVYNNVKSLDESIEKSLKGWTMDRICKTDLAILRLAIYEIKYRKDIPYKVSVNEAVELAKVFSEENSPSFINGVLARIINENVEEVNE